MVGDGRRPPNSAEVDGVHAGQLCMPVVRHHRAVIGIPAATRPRLVVPLDLDIMASGDGIDDTEPFGEDFGTDAIAGDGGDV